MIMTRRYKTIYLNAPGARQVFIAGTFNDWNPTCLPMQLTGEGEWTAHVALTPGHHEFKFVVDGKWCCGFDANGPVDGGDCCVPNPYGTMNRVLNVPA